MWKRHLCLTAALILLALSCFGCSGDTPSTPQPVAQNSPDTDGLKAEPATLVTIWGNVFLYGGTVPAVNTKVTVQTSVDGSTYYTYVTVRTNEYGYFECPPFSLGYGQWVRCASLGDVETRSYDGISAYMYFNLVQIIDGKVVVDPHQN